MQQKDQRLTSQKETPRVGFISAGRLLSSLQSKELSWIDFPTSEYIFFHSIILLRTYHVPDVVLSAGIDQYTGVNRVPGNLEFTFLEGVVGNLQVIS